MTEPEGQVCEGLYQQSWPQQMDNHKNEETPGAATAGASQNKNAQAESEYHRREKNRKVIAMLQNLARPQPPRRKRKGSRAAPPFAMVPWEILGSVAFKKLPPSAGKLLPIMLGMAGAVGHKGKAQFELPYSVAGERYGFSKATFHNAIVDLEKHGFIEVTKKGRLRGLCGGSNKYRLSERWRDFGTSRYISPGFDVDKTTWSP